MSTTGGEIPRKIHPQWDKAFMLASSIKYGSIEKIDVKDGRPRFMRVTYDFNLDDPEDLRRKFDELKTLPL